MRKCIDFGRGNVQFEMDLLSNTSTMTSLSPEYLGSQEKPLISDEVIRIVQQVIIMTITPLALLGIITNSINIRVFIEQGIKSNSTTIGLLSLSIFDMAGCLFLIPYCLCYFIGYIEGLAMQITCIAYATNLLYAHNMLSYCSTLTTVFLSIERTLCVIIPLRVKLIFTPKVTVWTIVSIFIFIFVVENIYTASTTIVWRLHPLLNETVAYAYDSDFGRNYLYYLSIMINTGLSSFAIVLVGVNTSIMVNKLKEFKKWREKNSGGSVSETEKKPMTSKDVELLKSVTAVTGIFLVCLSMYHIPSTAMIIIPGLSHSGINRNLYYTVYQVRFLFTAISSSINFFFYIRVSSRYKEAFMACFPRCSRVQEK